MLDANISAQLRAHFTKIVHPVVLRASLDDSETSRNMETLLTELAALSDNLSYERVDEDGVRRPSFQITEAGKDMGIRFAGLPMGHEFTSLILAILQAGGHPPAVDEARLEQIRTMPGRFEWEAFISLSCHNCPKVVQALNLMAVYNPNVRVTTIDGAVFQEEAKARNILAVPNVFLNGKEAFSGRKDLNEILAMCDTAGAERAAGALSEKAPFDVLVVGAGPAGATAAIYAARKGLRTGILAQRMGGQVNETADIENFTSIPKTDGSELARNLAAHIKAYDIDVIEPYAAEGVERGEDGLWHVRVEHGAVLRTKVLIACSGATWKKLGVPGEDELRGKGVAYCPHCDGPLFKGKNVAVIGGGNSGVEAAIDLAGICGHVTLVHRRNELAADQCLQEKLRSLPNVTLLLNVITEKLEAEDGKLARLVYHDRDTKAPGVLDVAGCFVQIGLLANTGWIRGVVDVNDRGEIITDARGTTSAEGIFAAGDCTDAPYKQIVVALGEGASASLGAFDHLIRMGSGNCPASK